MALRPPACWDCGFESRQLLGRLFWGLCCVLSGRGPCVGLIPRPGEPYRVWSVWVLSWNLENEEALAHQGLMRQGIYIYIYKFFYLNSQAVRKRHASLMAARSPVDIKIGYWANNPILSPLCYLLWHIETRHVIILSDKYRVTSCRLACRFNVACPYDHPHARRNSGRKLKTVVFRYKNVPVTIIRTFCSSDVHLTQNGGQFIWDHVWIWLYWSPFY